MRPWVLMKQFDIVFDEIMLKFGSAEWAANIVRLSHSRLVPVLWQGKPGEKQGTAAWDTLAIIETLAELFPEKAIWPRHAAARVMARSISAEMHAGFRALRQAMPMNIRARHPGKGMNEDVARDIARIEHNWKTAREHYGQNGPFLFGELSAADAMYAPVVMRLMTYAPPLSALSQAYCEAMQTSVGVAAWVAEARKETEFVAEDEPYSGSPGTAPTP